MGFDVGLCVQICRNRGRSTPKRNLGSPYSSASYRKQRFRRGRLEVAYIGKPIELGVQIVLREEGTGRQFAEQLVTPVREFSSTRLHALAWQTPQAPGEPKVGLSNWSQDTIDVTVRHFDGKNTRTESVVLPSARVRMLRLGRLTGAGWVDIRHSATPGDLLARGYVTAGSRSFAVPFVDPTECKSLAYHGMGLRLVGPTPKAFKPVILLRNIATEQRTATVRVQEEGMADRESAFFLGPYLLPPGEMLDLSRAMRELIEGGLGLATYCHQNEAMLLFSILIETISMESTYSTMSSAFLVASAVMVRPGL